MKNMPMETQSTSSGCLETYLPRDLDYIPEDLRNRAVTELFEDEDARVQGLRLLKSMLNDEAGLHWQEDDLFLLAFLRVRKFDLIRAFDVVKTFYRITGKYDELYFNFNFEDVRRTIDSNTIGMLPYRDSEGCVILLIRLDVWDPLAVPMSDIMRALTCGLLQAILSPATQIAGFKVIVDFNGFTLMQLPHITPTYLLLFAEALQNCFPGRFRAVHIVNENNLWSYVWVILKQFLTKKLRGRFHFHGKTGNTLHDYISPSILPAELNGKLPPYDNSDWGAKLEESAPYFTYVFSHGYEKYRTRSQKKYSKKTT